MKYPVKILFAVENREEFNELIFLVRELLAADHDQREFIFIKTNKIFHLDDYSGGEDDSLFSYIYHAKNPFNVNFKRLSIIKKIIIILLNALFLLRLTRRHKITHILSGVPLIFHRIIKLCRPAVIHLAYIRGLLLDSRKVTSVSDRFFFLTNKYNFLLPARFFNNYFADYIFTIGMINKNTLLERNIPESHIYLSGPLLLDRYRPLAEKEGDSLRQKELIYITQAYLWHLDHRGHEEQLTSIRGLLACIEENYAGQFKFILRVHPRDDRQIYAKILNEYSFTCRIDTSPAHNFLQEISAAKILVSGLSTLAFEWIYLGGRCVFYTTGILYKSNYTMFDRLGISPYFEPAELLQAIHLEQYPDLREQIGRIFYRHPSSNMQYVVDTVNTVLAPEE